MFGTKYNNWLANYFKDSNYKIENSKSPPGMISLYQCAALALDINDRTPITRDYTIIQKEFETYLQGLGKIVPFLDAVKTETTTKMNPSNIGKIEIYKRNEELRLAGPDELAKEISSVNWAFDIFTIGQLQEALRVNFIILSKVAYQDQIQKKSPNINFVYCVTTKPSDQFKAFILLEYSTDDVGKIGKFNLVLYNNNAIIDSFRNLPEPIIDMYLKRCHAIYLHENEFNDFKINNPRLRQDISFQSYLQPVHAISREPTVFQPLPSKIKSEFVSSAEKLFTITPSDGNINPERWISENKMNASKRTVDPVVKVLDILQKRGLDLKMFLKRTKQLTPKCPAKSISAYNSSDPRGETYEDLEKEFNLCCKENWEKEQSFCKKISVTINPSSVADLNLDVRYNLANSKRVFAENLLRYTSGNCGVLTSYFRQNKQQICDTMTNFVKQKISELNADPDYQNAVSEYEKNVAKVKQDYIDFDIIQKKIVAKTFDESDLNEATKIVDELSTTTIPEIEKLFQYLLKDTFYDKDKLLTNNVMITETLNEIKEQLRRIATIKISDPSFFQRMSKLFEIVKDTFTIFIQIVFSPVILNLVSFAGGSGSRKKTRNHKRKRHYLKKSRRFRYN